MRLASAAVTSLASAMLSTDAGSVTRASRSRSTATEMRRFARWRGQREADHRRRDAGFDADVALVCKRERHLENAEAASGEPSRELVDETVRRERERLDVRDRRRQVEPPLVTRRRHERRARIGNEPACAIERCDEIGADTSREARARQGARLPERRHAGRSERGEGVRRDVEMRKRQRSQRVVQRRRERVAVTLQSARANKKRRERRGREGEPRRITEIVRAARELDRQSLQAAEKAQAAADLGKHRIGWRERHRRRELSRPGRDPGECRTLELAIAVAQHDARGEDERRRDKLLRRDGGIERGGIGGDDVRIVAAGSDGERPRGVSRRLRSREDVERQRRKQQAGPQHVVRPNAGIITRASGALFQIVASDSPISASSAARRCASFAQKNSSSCGGCDRRAGEHRVRLSAMVDLVLEEMREQPGRALLHDAGAPRHGDRPGEIGVGQRRAQGNEPAIDRVLGDGQRRAGVERLFGLVKAAGREVRRLAVEAALERIDVIPVDGQDVVERGLDRGKEARASGNEIVLR